MAVFMLDTDSVSSTKSSLDNLSTQINNIQSDVSGYDTSCDEFDFNSAKNAIASNLEACAVKIQNASAYIDSVISSHTTLQNGMKFESSEEKAAKEAETAKKAVTKVSSTGGSYTTGGYTGGSYSTGGSSTGGGSYTPVVPTPVTTPQTTAPQVVDAKISKVDHTKLDTSKLTDDLKELAEQITYNEAGYALYGGMMLIACAASIGKVGDIVEFTMKDGSKIRCLVTENLEEGSEEVKFFINDEWKEDNEKNVTKDFVQNVEKTENYGNYEQSTGLVDLTNLPAIGEHTSKWNTLGDDWTVATTAISIPDYEKVISANKITQDSDKEKYGGYCLAFSYVHASNLYNGVTSDTNVSAGNYKHAAEFNTFKSDSKSDTLKMIYSEIVQGRPVVMQVNGNTSGTSRHFVTVVGFRNSITDPEQLTEKDLLIIDSWDGKVERMDQTNSRFMTTGKQTGKDYTGYYLRTLKPKKDTKTVQV